MRYKLAILILFFSSTVFVFLNLSACSTTLNLHGSYCSVDMLRGLINKITPEDIFTAVLDQFSFILLVFFSYFSVVILLKKLIRLIHYHRYKQFILVSLWPPLAASINQGLLARKNSPNCLI